MSRIDKIKNKTTKYLCLAKIERYEKALKYIIEHDWVLAKATSSERWIAEFIEVAREALRDEE